MQNGIITVAIERDFTIVKNSPVHGKGLFAKNIIPKGARIIEYAGKRVAKNKIATDMLNGLTSTAYIMNLDKTTVVDAERDGNDARFINHSCLPNCIVYFFNEVPYIYALREIIVGEELSFDYKMGFESEHGSLTIEQKKAFLPCNCGSINCRRTLIIN